MNLSNLLIAFFIATIFAWPILVKWSGLTPTMTSIVMCGAGMIIPVLAHLKTSHSKIWAPGLIVMIVIGVLNGFAVLLLSQKTADKSISAGAFMITLTIMGMILNVTLDRVINKEPLTVDKICGVILVVIAIYLVNKK